MRSEISDAGTPQRDADRFAALVVDAHGAGRRRRPLYQIAAIDPGMAELPTAGAFGRDDGEVVHAVVAEREGLRRTTVRPRPSPRILMKGARSVCSMRRGPAVGVLRPKALTSTFGPSFQPAPVDTPCKPDRHPNVTFNPSGVVGSTRAFSAGPHQGVSFNDLPDLFCIQLSFAFFAARTVRDSHSDLTAVPSALTGCSAFDSIVLFEVAVNVVQGAHAAVPFFLD